MSVGEDWCRWVCVGSVGLVVGIVGVGLVPLVGRSRSEGWIEMRFLGSRRVESPEDQPCLLRLSGESREAAENCLPGVGRRIS